MPGYGLKLTNGSIVFNLGGTNHTHQVISARLVNNSDDPETIATYSPDGDFVEDATPSFQLELVFLADWRAGGISDFLWSNANNTAEFSWEHHPDVTDSNVNFSGTVKLKAPDVGGDAGTTERTEVTLTCVGVPVYTRS